MTCGAWLMLSMPPASTMSASSSRIICPPLMADWSPEPHNRLTVSAGHFDGHARLERDVPGAVDRVGAGMQDVAEDDVIDHLRLHAGPLHRRARRNRAEIDRRDVLQLAGVVGHRGAGAAEDVDSMCGS